MAVACLVELLLQLLRTGLRQSQDLLLNALDLLLKGLELDCFLLGVLDVQGQLVKARVFLTRPAFHLDERMQGVNRVEGDHAVAVGNVEPFFGDTR